MNEIEIVERLTKVEERAKSNTHQIEELKPIVNEIHTMSNTLVQLVGEVHHTSENVMDLKDKVETLEQEPATKWKNSTKVVVNAVLGAIGGAIGAGILYLLTQI